MSKLEFQEAHINTPNLETSNSLQLEANKAIYFNPQENQAMRKVAALADDDFKIVDSAAKPQKVADANGDASSSGMPDMLAELLKQDPKDLSPALRGMQGLVENFRGETDKQQAIKTLGPAFEKSIADTDANFAKAGENLKVEGAKIQPDFDRAMSNLKDTNKKLNDAFSTVPEGDKERVKAVINLWNTEGNSGQLKKALEHEINKTPNLLQSAKDFQSAQKDAMPVMQKVQELKKTTEEASQDRILSRIIYSQALVEGGDVDKAKKVYAEGLAIQMGVPLDQLQKRLEQK